MTQALINTPKWRIIMAYPAMSRNDFAVTSLHDSDYALIAASYCTVDDLLVETSTHAS
jgi:hypothetical protein